MSGALLRLPDAQASALLASYAKARAERRNRTAFGAALLVVALLAASHTAEVDPAKFAGNIHNFTSYIGRIFHLDNGASVFTDIPEWFWGLRNWLRLLLETVLMAYVGTALGVLGALPLCFVASRNLTRSAGLVWVARRLLEFSRTVPEIVFALIFVVAFGLGPMPGVLAIALHTMGALGKLFAEVNENIDMKPVQGVAAAGGSWFAQIRFGVLPEVVPNFLSYGLLRFEINVRGAAVMGFVGAGGIGQTLVESIRKFYYSDVSAILVLIIGTVMLMDLATQTLRRRLLEGAGA